MKIKFLLFTMLSLGPIFVFAQVTTKKNPKSNMDTTAKWKSVPKAEKYDAKAHQWPKKDSLKTLETRNDSIKRKSKPTKGNKKSNP